MKTENIQKIFKKKFLDKWGKYNVYLVDDEVIRNKAEYAEEFGDYGVNLGKNGLSTINFSFIPKNEIWIAKSIKSSERHFILDNALAYIRNIERKVPSGEAYNNALKHEQSGRTEETIMKLHLKKKIVFNNPSHKNVISKVYLHKFGVIEDNDEPVNIYLINGEVVRDLYKTDYVEGGHGYVYEWIPEDEIWIDSILDFQEIPVIVLHEFTERTLMKYKHFPYARAHNAASKVEFEHRGIFNKKDMLNLTIRIVMNKFLKDIKY